MTSTYATRLMILHASLGLVSAGCNKSSGTEDSDLDTGSGGIYATGGAGYSVVSTGGSSANSVILAGGSQTTGGQVATTGGMSAIATGGMSAIATGGFVATGGATTAAISPGSGNCTINGTASISPGMATVGIIEWTASANVVAAELQYDLINPPANAICRHGSAPVDLTKPNFHTLLLGLKQSSDYFVRVDALLDDGTVCSSEYFTLTTGALAGAPTITQTITNASAMAGGFIVTSTGLGTSGGYGTSGGGSNSAFILDADGAVVWSAPAPTQCSRALMDYEGVNVWMLALNVKNTGGEMRFLSMDGQTSRTQISGLSGAHHDFAVLPGKIAAMVWATSGSDPESNLVEMASDGTGSPTTMFKIGSNLYVGGPSANGATGSNTYHCNAIHYYPSDDSFTIADRNPNACVKVSHGGAIQWQVGGSCTDAPAGAANCVPEGWNINHGHHLLSDGTFLMFNNGSSAPSRVFEYILDESGPVTATQVQDFASGSSYSSVFGDVQRLPNGNTLITYSSTGQILEVDPTWNTVQSLKTNSLGYAEWRRTLYGPPER